MACKRKETLKRLLKRHIEKTHNPRPQYSEGTAFKKHVDQCHSYVKQFSCNQCGKGFYRKCNLKEHSLIHTGQRRYKCTVCERTFVRSDTLKSHLSTHKAEKSYEYMLERHIRQCHTHVKHKCTHFERWFYGQHHLRAHITMHTGEKPNICTICGKSYNQPGNLKRHLQKHEKLKAFRYSSCKRGFHYRKSWQTQLR